LALAEVALPWCRGAVIMAVTRTKVAKGVLGQNLNDYSLFIHEYNPLFFFERMHAHMLPSSADVLQHCT
jgi:hypothetical protein